MKDLFQALSRTNDGAVVLNEQQKIIFWNQAAQAILGFEAEEVINRPCYKVFGGRDEQGRMLCRLYCRVRINVLHDNDLPNFDMYVLTSDEVGKWINITTFAFPTDKGDPEYLIVHLFRDVMQKKSNERFVEEIISVTEELRNKNGIPDLMTTTDFRSNPGYDALTPREREVLLLLAQGLSTDEMATMLCITPATIRNHIQNIIGKLRVHSRLEAVAYAYQRGLVEVGESCVPYQ